MHYRIFSLTTVRMTVFWVLNILHIFKRHRINVRKMGVRFCLFFFFFITVHLKTSNLFSEVVERKAKLQAVCRRGKTVFLSEAVWWWKNMHVWRVRLHKVNQCISTFSNFVSTMVRWCDVRPVFMWIIFWIFGGRGNMLWSWKIHCLLKHKTRNFT
jgi:hypothetical protein